MPKRFSERHGFDMIAPKITIIRDFPVEHREAVIRIAKQLGTDTALLREAMLEVLITGIDTSDRNHDFIWPNLVYALEECGWPKVYNISEEIYKIMKNTQTSFGRSVQTDHRQEYMDRLNHFFIEKGFGWEMRNGLIEYRGSEPFRIATTSAEESLQDRGFDHSANEVREAMRDLSRRPEPDLAGAVYHATQALEAIAGIDTKSSGKSLGKMIPSLNLPAPLDEATHKLWGFVSGYVRHGNEEKQIDEEEAEMAVTVACALTTFIAKRQPLVASNSLPVDDDDLPFE